MVFEDKPDDEYTEEELAELKKKTDFACECSNSDLDQFIFVEEISGYASYSIRSFASGRLIADTDSYESQTTNVNDSYIECLRCGNNIRNHPAVEWD